MALPRTAAQPVAAIWRRRACPGYIFAVRVLVLTYETPSYPGAGGPSRQHSLLEPLAERHDIRVVSTGGRPPFGSLPRNVDIRLIEAGPAAGRPDGTWLRKNLDHYLGGEPWLYQLAGHHRRALAAVLPDEHARFRPDIVVVEHAELAPLLRTVPSGTPTVLVLHNMLVTIQRQLVKTEPTTWARAKAVAEIGFMGYQQRRDLRAATVTVVVSEGDARLARRLRPSSRVAVVPNCINADYFARNGARSSRPTLVMTASYHYKPNQDAAIELLHEVLPRVRERVPDVELLLVGQQFPSWLLMEVDRCPNARAMSDVADIRPVLQQAWVALAPLRHGSGAPLKVLEALAAEVPVVATPRAAHALDLGEATGVVAGDDAAALAEQAAGLLRDPARRDALGAAGRDIVRQRFHRDVVAPKLEAVWRNAVAAARR